MKTVILALSLFALVLAFKVCPDSVAPLPELQTMLTSGEPDVAQDALREALEHHPEDLELLCAAAEFHLRREPARHFNPRLALHYAMRAERVAAGTSQRAASLLQRALELGQD